MKVKEITTYQPLFFFFFLIEQWREWEGGPTHPCFYTMFPPWVRLRTTIAPRADLYSVSHARADQLVYTHYTIKIFFFFIYVFFIR